jgi:hypothetical protein
MAPSCSRPSSSASSLSTAGASSLNLAALAIDEEVDAPSSYQQPVATRAPSTPSYRYSPTPMSQSHRDSGSSMKRGYFHILDEECRGSAGKQYHSSRESKLHRREGWGSVDSRRAYSDLSSLSRQGKEGRSLNSSHSSLSSTSALDDDTRYSFDANDWGYFVDTP